MTENITTNDAAKAPSVPETAALPAPFDIDNWITGALLPQESADVYRAGNAPAEASALKRQIEIERSLEDVERSSADVARYVQLEKQYEEVLTRWAASRITVFVSAIEPERFREMRAEHDRKTAGMDVATANEIFGFMILTEAVVGIAEPDKTYVDVEGQPLPYEPVVWKMNQVRALNKAIGPVQMKLILDARRTAQNSLPTVDADFLHRNSGPTED